jgi:hypothetical protein
MGIIAPNHFPNIDPDAFVIMPNYVHGIVVINEDINDHVRAKHPEMMAAVIKSPCPGCFAPTYGSW